MNELIISTLPPEDSDGVVVSKLEKPDILLSPLTRICPICRHEITLYRCLFEVEITEQEGVYYTIIGACAGYISILDGTEYIVCLYSHLDKLL